ncbi:hypothetical protein SUGI_0352310 [Cryptomeria japonica]|nr:hypothetical protein SUGI_0352310 [Cryptomeria japonica]
MESYLIYYNTHIFANFVASALFYSYPLLQILLLVIAGIKKPIKEVNIKLRMDPKHKSFGVVVIYGAGGMGKTYLGNAVYSKLNLKGYNYSSVIMDLDSKKNNIKRMQEQILFDLFPGYNYGREIKLSDTEQGKKELKSAFKKENKPVFLFIDNVLRAQDLKDLLPEGLERLGKHIRLLLTARELSSTNMFDQEFRRKYCVEPLDEKDARKVLCKGKINLDRIKGDVDQIVKICGGFPLVLKIVGLHLKNQEYRADRCSQILNALQKGKEIKESGLSECMVDFVFKRFEESTQDAFLDICCFFNGMRRNVVEYTVGSMALKALEDAALITIKVEPEYYAPMQKDDAVIVVHDVIKAKGQNMARSSRITDIESFEEAVQEKRLQEIKGIALFCDKHHPSYVLENKHLNSMRKSLRVLRLGPNIRVSAKSEMRFPELRDIYLKEFFPCVPFNSEALENLAVYRGPLPKDVFHKLPQSLRQITLSKSTELKCQSKPIQMDLNSSLEDLSVVSLSMKRLPMKLESFSALKTLRLLKCYEMEELTEVIRGLRSLTSLILVGCSLKRLPPILNRLTHLDLVDCDKLHDCEKMGDLKALQFLGLNGCTSLKKLPATFGNLKNLRYLNLRRCSSLEEVPGFQRLVGLKYFNVQSCPKLRGKFSNRPKDLRFQG